MRPVHIIGVPLDLGAGRRGVDMGPSAFRIAGLGEQIAGLGYTVVDKGDLPAPIPETQTPSTFSGTFTHRPAALIKRFSGMNGVLLWIRCSLRRNTDWRAPI